MITAPRCHERHCRHFLGVIAAPDMEQTERHHCRAFPDGIPAEIVNGTDLHLARHPAQTNDIVYERGPFEWELAYEAHQAAQAAEEVPTDE